MAIIVAQDTALPTSGNLADVIVTTMWFDNTDITAAVSDIVPVMKGLINNLAGVWSQIVSQNGHVIKLTDIADPQPRYPFYEETWNTTVAPSGSTAPPEVSLVASFQGDRLSGVPQARRRGRMYVGPLRLTHLGNDGRPTPALITQLTAIMDDFLTASAAMTATTWGVYSRAGSFITEVTNGWIDNEFDTQRRRGRLATSRTVYP